MKEMNPRNSQGHIEALLNLQEPFQKDEEVLEAFEKILLLRRAYREKRQEEEDSPGNTFLVQEKACTRHFHELLSEAEKTALGKALSQKRFNRLEKEIVVLLVWKEVCESNNRRENWGERSDTSGVSRMLETNKKLSLAVLRAVDPLGRLASCDLVQVDEDEYPKNPDLEVSDILLEKLIQAPNGEGDFWKVKSQKALLERALPLIRMMAHHSENMERNVSHQIHFKQDTKRSWQKMVRLFDLFENTLERHPKWPLYEMTEWFMAEQIIALLLLGKELGYLNPSDSVFTGKGLVRAASKNISDFPKVMGKLKSFGHLRKNRIIEVAGGLADQMGTEDDTTLENCEFELTDAFLERMNIRRNRDNEETARKPLMRMDQMVWSREIRQSIETALAQAKNHKVLFETWGLGESMPYGQGITLLFYGPPGTGKTSSAEAIAHALDRKILMVNYGEIQSKWVGQTEKHIVRAFRQAAAGNAVLFWDEADAMFYDRDHARATWESRDVNVLLQEIEKFRGVCILTTNRRGFLDKALDRRITMKVEFPRPDVKSRLRIWKKMLPPRMPLDKDLDFEKLAEQDLSGGEIKNIILNAARRAVQRGAQTRLCQADFDWALELESRNKAKSKAFLGFHKKAE